MTNNKNNNNSNSNVNDDGTTMTSAEILVRKAAWQIGFGEDDTVDKNNRVSIIVNKNNQNRLNQICQRLMDEYLLEDWQLPALEASQWKELGAPMGLMASIRALVEYPDVIKAKSRVGGEFSTDLNFQGRRGSNTVLFDRLSEVSHRGNNFGRSQRLPSQGQEALLPSILSVANGPPAPNEDDEEDYSDLFAHDGQQKTLDGAKERKIDGVEVQWHDLPPRTSRPSDA